MPLLFVSQDAKDDLELIWLENSQIAASIAVLLQELQNDDDILDRLTQHDFGSSEIEADFHISKWYEQWNTGKDLWRLKVWELDKLYPGTKYRIIYAFIPSKLHYHILAIAPRNFNYDSKSPITQRIIRAYEEL